MKVKILRADYSGCGFYRAEEPARAVNAADLGVEVEVVDYLDAESDGNGNVRRVLDVQADVVVFQRPLALNMLQSMLQLQAQGVRCIVEVDDALDLVQPSNVAYPSVAPHLSPKSHWGNLKRACLLADWVTVSTPALIRYAPHGRVSVVRNRVPQSLTEMPYKGIYDIGWSGSLVSHLMDIAVVKNQLAETKFHVVGDSTGIQQMMSLDAPPTETGWLPISEYYEALAELKVGIAPLELNRFNDAKSELKILEFSALSIPFVASPSPEYLRFVSRYGGEIASKTRHWKTKPEKLMNNPDYARELGENLREQMRKHCTVESAADRWVDAWRSALERIKTT